MRLEVTESIYCTWLKFSTFNVDSQIEYVHPGLISFVSGQPTRNQQWVLLDIFQKATKFSNFAHSRA